MASCPPEVRLALEDVAVAYAHAADSLDDPGDVCALFVEQGVYDLSGVGFPRLVGHDAIRGFFERSFAAMAAQAHYLSNFAVTRWSGERASLRAYVRAMGHYREGGRITVHARYYFDLVLVEGAWKIETFSLDALLPVESEAV